MPVFEQGVGSSGGLMKACGRGGPPLCFISNLGSFWCGGHSESALFFQYRSVSCLTRVGPRDHRRRVDPNFRLSGPGTRMNSHERS